jgi:Tol biopolymer transport system component
MRRRSRERLAWALAAVFGTAAALGFGWASHLRRVVGDSGRPLRAELVAPPDLGVAPVTVGAVALSPDGQRLSFVTGALGNSALAVRELATGETRRLAGTTDGSFPFWSPDGRWLAFFAEGRLKKVEAAGGPVQAVCEAHAGRGGTWNADGAIVFAPDITGPLVKVSAGGGGPVALTRTTDPRVTHRNPWFLPDGRHFLFTIRDTASGSFGAVAVASLDGGEPKVLLQRGSNPQYADGFLFTVVDGNLVAQRFDARKLVLEGQGQPIAEAVDYWNPRDLANFSVSPAGLLAYRQIHLRRTQLVWLDRGGKELATLGEPSYFAGLAQQGPHLGARGRILAAARSDALGANADVWTMDLARPQMTRATFLSAPTNYLGAAVSPDGSRLAVSTASVGGAGGSTLWIQPLAGGGSRQSLLEKGSFNVFEWTPDGAALVGVTQEAGSGFDIAYVSLKDPSRVVHVTTSPFDEGAPALSPDGRWIAYQSNETGRSEVFVIDFPGGARKWQLSRSGGQTPSWRSDGREVYFSGPDGASAVAVTAGSGTIESGTPERLPFPKGTLRADGRVFSPDGKRFLAERFDSEAFTEPIRLVRGWRRLVEK